MAVPHWFPLSFSDLRGWADDDLDAALGAYRVTAAAPDGPDAPGVDDARAWFEATFRPVLIEDGSPMRFTAYYEPELPAAPARTDRFAHPIYAAPSDPGAYDRARIDAGALSGRGLEIAWLESPVDAFFLQVQGSGRLSFPDGTVLRVNFAARNGRPYTSIGRTLIAEGLLPADTASAQEVRDWLIANPGAARSLMQRNESFVFFRALTGLSPEAGPIGAMGRSVTPLRSIAVDPDVTPLGLPVWIEMDGAPHLDRLMIAQDTGSAIKGAQRADIFMGTGAAAGSVAGTVDCGGRMVVLMPLALIAERGRA